MPSCHECLCDIQGEAAKIQVSIAAILTAKAELSKTVQAETELLARPELVHKHPELQWEQAGHGKLPKLGLAKQLFARDMKLSDFS